MSTFLITLREGAEAALIVAIVLAWLRSSGAAARARWVWGGVAAAAAAAVGVGTALHLTVGALEGRAEAIAEGVVALAAVGMLTWMVWWMAARARSLRSQVEARTAGAVESGGGWALAAVGFVAVLREGLETALFLIGAGSEDGIAQLGGGLAGLAAAAALGWAVYQGGRRIRLGLFFRVTGILLVLFAAGLVSKAAHEFQEAGLLPALLDPAWDLGFGDPGAGGLGRVASELFGWTPAPSLLQVVAYWVYLVPVAVLFGRRLRPAVLPAEAADREEAVRRH